MTNRFSMLRQKMPGPLLAAVEYLWPNWEELLFRRQCESKRWYRKSLGSLFRLGLLLCGVTLLSAVLLLFAKGFWEVYLATPMGQQYVNMSWRTSVIITRLFAMDYVDLAVSLSLTSVKYLLVVGAVAKFTVIKRYYYDGQGVIVILIWYVVCGLMVAKSIAVSHGLEANIAQLLCIVPVASLFSTSFSFASQVVPEFNIVRMGQYFLQLRATARRRRNSCR